MANRIQPGHRTGVKKVSGGGDIGRFATMTLLFCLCAVFILSVAGYFTVKFIMEKSKIQEEMVAINKKIEQMKRDLETERNKHALYTSEAFIRNRIAYFKLPLISTQVANTRKMVLFSRVQLQSCFSNTGRPVLPHNKINGQSNYRQNYR